MSNLFVLGATCLGADVFVDSDTVKIAQQALNDQAGAGLVVDGKIGPKTRAAVKKFNAAHGASGEDVIQATLDALKVNPLAAPVAKGGTQHVAAQAVAAAAASVTPAAEGGELLIFAGKSPAQKIGIIAAIAAGGLALVIGGAALIFGGGNR